MADEPPSELLTGAQAGDPEAQCLLGRWYAEQGSDAEAAEMWLRRAANQGLARAKHNLGVLALQTNREDTAREWLRSAAEDGWLPSIMALGALTEQAGDVQHAIPLYEIAATRGYADAQDALGRIAFDLDTEEDYVTSRYWSELAAEQGNPYSQARLGTIYHEGLGVPRDPRQAAAWWLSAARLGHDGAQLLIGAAYHQGIGLTANRVEAAFWLTRSAAQENQGAKAYLPRVQAEMTDEDEAALMAKFRDVEQGRA
jgi:TPR repeat protein